MGAVIKLLSARAAGSDTVGVVGPLLDRVEARLRDFFGPSIFLDSAYQRLRFVKSDEELACRRIAAALNDRALEALAEGAGPGTLETESIALIASAYLGAGGTHHIHCLASTSEGALKPSCPRRAPGEVALSLVTLLFAK